MLGRQQIAGIPTALHELFKNAYDAFATRVEVDLLVQRRTLILRDNGFGMTEADFRDRWLTLGTESKIGQGEHIAPWLGDYGNVPRRMLGEKGIGRLAIASIGPAVLVLTRAKRDNGLHDLVVSLIHWALFEVPGLDLDRIRIPIISLPGGTLPEQADVERLINTITENITLIGDTIPSGVRSMIAADLNLMKFSPRSVLEALASGRPPDEPALSLLGNGCGTHFIIRAYDQVLDADLSQETDSEASALERFLIGFGNTMLPDFPAPPIKAAFRQHRSDGEIRDFIGERSFFTPEEYNTADQIIEGHFDEYGQFAGTVKIFDRPPVPYTLNWPGAKGNLALCGPFDIRFAYMQGLPHQSLLTKESWAILDAKLSRIGGLYIYRDGIRILPYGNHDYDFLNIEKRRTFKATDWYFSYRRLFGAIVVSSLSNSALQEKAGREGFRENMAYRQFREMLENLFKSLAIDFFRKDAPLGEEFNRIKAELDERKDLLERRDKLVKVRKDKFGNALGVFFDRVEHGEPNADAEHVKDRFTSKFDSIAALDDPDQMGEELHRLEREIRDAVDNLRQKYRVSRPQGIGLTKQMTSDWQAYRRIYVELEQTCFAQLSSHFDARLTELLEERGAALNRRLLVREALENRQQNIRRNAARGEREAREGLTRARDSITRGIAASIHRLHNEISVVLSDFERTAIADLDGGAVVELRGVLERRLDSSAEREIQFLGKLREQMDDLSQAISAGMLPDDVTSALEDSNRELTEELEDSLHWAQVGMALGIVQHEFTGVVTKIKRGINQLGPWAKGTPELGELFGDLRTGFSHLEEYLRLFAPLDRRLQRQKVDLSGEQIRSYVLNVFGDRFDRHHISFESTDDFRKWSIKVFPSTLLPPFLNIVDNASYWLAHSSQTRRQIRIDLHPEGIVVENNGPGIEQRLAERIFDFGFTTKQNGRGMGLSIARRALRHEGMDLLLLTPGIGNPVRFLIKLVREEETI
jgi:signal transduction histidine kinase